MNKYEKLQNEDIKTKHHYIPVTYSKAWVNKDGKLSIKEKNSKKEYDSLPTKTLFEKNLNKLSLIKEKHFSFVKERYPDFFNSDSESLQQMKTFLNKLYETSKLIENCIEGDLSKILALEDKDKMELEKIREILLNNLIEDQFSNVESHYGEFMQDLLSNSSLYKNKWQYLIEFLANQYYRGKAYLNIKYKELEPSFNDDDIKNIILLSSFIEIELLIEHFRKGYLIIKLIENTSSQGFISSDSPAFAANLNYLGIQSEYILPISPKYLVAIKRIEDINNDSDATLFIKECSDLKTIQNINDIISYYSFSRIIQSPEIENIC